MRSLQPCPQILDWDKSVRDLFTSVKSFVVEAEGDFADTGPWFFELGEKIHNWLREIIRIMLQLSSYLRPIP